MTGKPFEFLDKDLAAKLARKLADLQQGGGVRLPFDVVLGYWLNGQGARKTLQGAPYFGGWAFDGDTLDLTAPLVAPIPPTFAEYELTNREGGDFRVYATRWLAVAPICRRTGWFLEGVRQAKYFDGCRKHLQYLTYIATYDDEGKLYIPMGPAVLTAKGAGTQQFLEALSVWEKGTAKARKDLASGISHKFFFAPLGTSGKTPEVVQAGKSKTSPVTPIRCLLPQQVTLDYLKLAYVGSEIAEKLVELGEQAAEWVKEWAQPRKDGKEEEVVGSEYVEDEIPF